MSNATTKAAMPPQPCKPPPFFEGPILRPSPAPKGVGPGRALVPGLVSHTPLPRPLFPICDLFRAPPPRPSFPTWTARIQPATGKQVQSWPASPIAGRTNESKLRRFWRGSSPVAGPRRPRKQPAGKTRWHESNRLEPTATLRRAEAWDPMSQAAEAGGAGLALPVALPRPRLCRGVSCSASHTAMMPPRPRRRHD